MSDPSLTEFLLARIAEDEVTAREDGADAMVGWRWKHFPPEAYEVIQSTTLARSKRVLADCEAKRQRVPVLAEMEADPDNRLSSYAYALLCREAMPYADHPDYQEDWRPEPSRSTS